MEVKLTCNTATGRVVIQVIHPVHPVRPAMAVLVLHGTTNGFQALVMRNRNMCVKVSVNCFYKQYYRLRYFTSIFHHYKISQFTVIYCQATAQRCATIWNICGLRGSALTQIRWGGKWVHLTQFYCRGHPSLCQKLSKLVETWRRSGENNFDCFFWDTVYNYVPKIMKIGWQ